MGGSRPVTDWAADWDFYSRQYHDDAPTVWSTLRERCPIPRTERYGGAWALIRYDDVCAAAHDVGTFSSRHPSLLEDYEAPSMDIVPIDLDPPLHSAFRRVMLPQFGPAATAALRPLTEQICEQLLDDLAGRHNVDASADYAKHIPVAVTAAMLGVRAGDAELFRSWVHDIVERPDDPAKLTRAVKAALDYFRAQLTQRRQQPGDDFISLLARSDLHGAPIPDRTIASAALFLLLAGIDTVWTTLGAAILHLAQQPDDLDRLHAEPALLPTAIEEVLRFYAPAELARQVTRDTELDGVHLRAGEHVLLSFPAANRDPAVFPDADRFIIDRTYNRHLGFGVGVHRCIGSNIARMELHVALTAWLRRFPRFTPDPSQPVRYTEGGGIRGPRRVPLIIDQVP